MQGPASQTPSSVRLEELLPGSAEVASKGGGLCGGEGQVLVGREEFPGRMLRAGRKTHVVTASLLRVLARGEPECNGAHDGH